MFLWFLILMLIKKDKKMSMKTKIKYKGTLRSKEKKEFRPREGMKASIQRGSWSFRLGQTVRRE